MVYLADPHEAMEKSMWCYERGMLPVIGEKDPDMAMYAAGKYRIDSLICDNASLAMLRPYLSSCGGIDSITVIDRAFNTQELLPFATFAKEVRLVLSLPETRRARAAELSDMPTFIPLANCLLEDGSSLVVTKVARLALPIIQVRHAHPARTTWFLERISKKDHGSDEFIASTHERCRDRSAWREVADRTRCKRREGRVGTRRVGLQRLVLYLSPARKHDRELPRRARYRVGRSECHSGTRSVGRDNDAVREYRGGVHDRGEVAELRARFIHQVIARTCAVHAKSHEDRNDKIYNDGLVVFMR